MERRKQVPARIGVFGIGLAAYWSQFPGLRERLTGNQCHVEAEIAALGAQVISAGLVDTAPASAAAGDQFAREQVDLVVCYVGTYATSSQVLPTVQRARAPVLVLNLQPVAALDYAHTDTGKWLANCCACCVPEIAGAFTRAHIAFNVVSGTLHDDARAWGEIASWVRAAGVQRAMRDARFGVLGHTYPGMLDLYSDPTVPHAQLGTHIELLEMDDLQTRVEAVTAPEIATKRAEIAETFVQAAPGADPIARPITEAALDWSARVACGLDRLAADFALDGLTYYYRGLDGNANEELAAALIVGNSLLTARGIPAAGEGDLKTCLGMFILDRLGAGGSFTEFYAMDFTDGFLLMGHDGPAHLALSDGKPTMRALGVYHGKRGGGLSVEMRVRTGPITILGVTQTAEGRLKLLVAEGASLPGPTLAIGNTNARLRFALDPAAFMDRWCAEGPTHHVALGIGHQAGVLRKLARLRGLELVVVAS